MVERKTWQEFRDTGLFLLINQFLHIFGWSLVVVVDNPTGEVVQVYPARVKFRGFDNEDTTEAYKKISDYMASNASTLKEEADAD